ncbi:GDP-mannose 4,6-dehydratase, partial [Patescibacteria group bacterium]|nr:GDP-mannose 4,6-dehydratase [Patescibacteria group bacterium]
NTHKVNVCGTVNILEAVRKAKTSPKIIYSSAASVYGNPIYSPVDEIHPTNPQNPYGASKLCGESYCTAYHYTYGLPTMILRYSNVYGSGITSPNAMENFVNAAMDGKPLSLYGGGTQRKQFTHIDDVCRGTVLAMKSKIEHGVYNIAGGNDSIISIKTLAEKVINIVGAGSIEYKEERQGDVHVPDLRISILKAKYELGYIPKKSIQRGLEEYIAYKKSHATI